HAAAALILAQSILFAGVALRTMSSVEGNRELLRRFLRSQSGSVPHPVREQVRLMPPPPRLVAIGANPIHRPPPIPRRVIVAKGHIGNRPFLKYSDASVEIDTLLGRRCFITIDAAEEFVGGTAVMDAAEPADVALSA
ncbi:MAG: hypothetical protein ABL907_17820, partial [Hyphomicrobium sp.]